MIWENKRAFDSCIFLSLVFFTYAEYWTNFFELLNHSQNYPPWHLPAFKHVRHIIGEILSSTLHYSNGPKKNMFMDIKFPSSSCDYVLYFLLVLMIMYAYHDNHCPPHISTKNYCNKFFTHMFLNMYFVTAEKLSQYAKLLISWQVFEKVSIK